MNPGCQMRSRVNVVTHSKVHHLRGSRGSVRLRGTARLRRLSQTGEADIRSQSLLLKEHSRGAMHTTRYKKAKSEQQPFHMHAVVLNLDAALNRGGVLQSLPI